MCDTTSQQRANSTLNQTLDFLGQSQAYARYSVCASPPYILELPNEQMASGLPFDEARSLAKHWNQEYQAIDPTGWCVLSFQVVREGVKARKIRHADGCQPGDFLFWTTEEPTKNPAVTIEIGHWGEVVSASNGVPKHCLDAAGQAVAFPQRG